MWVCRVEGSDLYGDQNKGKRENVRVCHGLGQSIAWVLHYHHFSAVD